MGMIPFKNMCRRTEMHQMKLHVLRFKLSEFHLKLSLKEVSALVVGSRYRFILVIGPCSSHLILRSY